MQTLVDLLSDMQRLGRREAVRWSNGFRTWIATYSDLYGKIGAVVQYFGAFGLRKGDRVLIRAENRMEWIAAFWACVARGLEVVPVDYRFSPELVERITNESNPQLIIDNARLDAISALPAVPQFTPAHVTPDDIVEIVYTSGTTGDPKGVVHRHRNICSNLRPFQKEIAKYKKWARPFQPIRILDLLPLSHMFGQSLGLFIPIFLEGSAAFTTELHPGKITRFVHDNRISVIVAVPRMLETLKTEKPHRKFGWKFWAFVVGGARLEPDLEEFWKRRRFAVIQGYGLTEASPVVAVNHPFHTQTGSLGKVVEGQDVMIAPDGEILVRGENVTTTNGDWLHTGDLGQIDEEGRLYFRGRKKDVIVTPEGLNVFPEDVEAVLNSFPDVRESAVVGGDQVRAVLILADANADAETIIRRANDRLESHQRIRDWSIWPAEEFPRTPSTLKLKRHEIARRIQTEQLASVKRDRVDLTAMSSLERVELLSDLESKYQVELDEESFSQLKSTEELEDWLARPDIATTSEPEGAALSDWARSSLARAFRKVFQRVVALPLYRHYLPLSVIGLENLDGLQPPVIFAANHVSHLDVPTIYTALPRRWRERLAPAMMKDHFRAYFEPQGRSWKDISLAAISYFLACAIFNAYPLPQQMSGTRRALRYTGDLISRGFCPIVFPEGLRTPDGQIHSFRPGIGMMAVRLRVPVVPIRLRGLYEIYSLHDSWPRRGPVHVSIGAPLSFSSDISYDDAANGIEEVLKKL